MNESVKVNTYTKKERNAYLAGLAGQNIMYNIIGQTFSYFLQFVILIPAGIVGAMLAVLKVWDGINDPIMGHIIDRTRTKWGKCRPYLIFTPIPIFLVTMFCFMNGFYDNSVKFSWNNFFVVAWASLAFFLWDVLYTAGDVPLWGITALMTESDKDRIKLLSLARIFAGVGSGIALLSIQSVSLSLGEMLRPYFGSTMKAERMGFFLGALIFAVVGTALFQLAGIFTRERIAPSPEKNSLIDSFKIMYKNKPFFQLMLSGILASPKQLITIAAFPLISYYYANKDGLLNTLYIAVLGGSVLISGFIATALTPKILKHISKKDLYNYSNLIGAIPYGAIMILYFIAPTKLADPLYVAISAILFFFAGASNGFTAVLTSLMIADAVDYEEYRTGIRTDGVFFAGQSFITKLTTGLATIISGIAYSIVKFSDANVQVVNDYIAAGGLARENPEFQPYMFIMFFLVSIPPLIGSLLMVIPTWKYALSDEEHRRILDELNIRRHQARLKAEAEAEAQAE
jgi:sugar (glycoside-pentoside-hexuronide) transporter